MQKRYQTGELYKTIRQVGLPCLNVVKESHAFPQRLFSQQGSTVVEFAFVLIFLLLFAIVFLNIAGVLLAHERISYAAYSGARASSVHGNAAVAVHGTGGKIFVAKTGAVREHLTLPKILAPTTRSITIEARFNIPVEEAEGGDN